MNLEFLPVRICLIDIQLNIINCTSSFAEWLGYSREEILAQNSIGSITLQPTLLKTKINSNLGSKREFVGLVFLTSKGENIECNVEISHNSDSELFFMNVTDRNNVTEIKLDPNNTFSEFISLAEYIPNLIIQVDLNFEIIYANESAESFFNDLRYGEKLSKLIPDKAACDKISNRLKLSIDNPVILNSYCPEISIYNQSFEISIFPNFDLSNSINSFTFFFSDITEKVNNQKISSDNEFLKGEITLRDRELRVYQNELEQQINALNEVALVAQLDKNFNIIHTNDLYYSFLGYKKQSFDIENFYKKSLNAESVNIRTLKKGKIWKGEINLKDHSNAIKTVITTIIPFYNLHNIIEKYYCISFDITESKKLQKELVEALVAEKELSRMKTRFLSTASHQFRTPLAVIQANSELIRLILKKLDFERKEQIFQALSRTFIEINSITELLNDVLSYEGASSRTKKPYFEDTDLSEIINYIIRQYLNIKENKNRLNFSISGEFRKLRLDKKLILNSLSNLISNALKYSDDLVQIDLQFHENFTEIWVTDKGIGIPEEEVESLFQPFFRGNASIKYEGTGLGLSIAKEYIEINHGKITVNTEENVGTSFIIKFPQ